MIQAIVAGEKQKHQQDEEDEEDEVKILYLDSRCPARAALPQQYSERKEQKAQAREEYMVLRNNLLGTENGVMRCDVEEIVTVIAQREERGQQQPEDFGISNLFDLNNVNAWTLVVC
ncbi:hypothetical protein NC651_039376 [Populus alba x Populus x berolinensis]|nr:hypothetical protein NC651_039376 [Populus alba x Populus x berolinensis]